MKKLSILFIFLIIVAIFSTPAVPVSALSLEEYFTLTYDVDFSKTTVAPNEQFTVTVTGIAVCTKDLEFPYNAVTEVKTKGQIVAYNQSDDSSVVLNSGYTLDITPAPTKAGESAEDSQTLTLNFPSDTTAGKYDIMGELIQAQAKAVVWLDVTDYMPSSKKMGTLTLKSSSGSNGGGSSGGSGDESTTTPVATPTPTTSQSTAVDITGKDIRDYLDSEDTTRESLYAHSDNDIWKISLAQKTKIQLVNDNINQINLTPVTAPSSNTDYITILDKVYELNPSGLTFNPPAYLSVSYNPEIVPAGVSAAKLEIGQWDSTSSSWEPLNCLVDTQLHTITANINHFSSYAVLAYTHPANFVLSDFSITPDTAGVAEPITVKVNVANEGDISGQYVIIYKINGIESDNRTVALAGGEKQVVSFNSTFSTLGNYTLSLGSQAGLLSIESSSSTQTPNSTTVSDTSDFSFSDLHITPVNVKFGKTARVDVTVTNISQKSATCLLKLALDSSIIETKEVALSSGAKQVVTFNVFNASLGQHTVNINGISATFQVAQTSGGIFQNWWIFIVIGLLVILACVILCIKYLKRK